MEPATNRDRIIELIRLLKIGEGSEEQEDEWVAELKDLSPHPKIMDLIFYPDTEEPMTDEQIADRALAYEPGDDENYRSKWYFD